MQTIINEEDIGFNIEPRICRVKAKQYDTERILKFTLLDDVSTVDMSDISHIYWREKFSDNTILPPVEIPTSNITSNGSLLTVQLTRDMLSVPGVAIVDIVFTKGNFEPQFDPETNELLESNHRVLTTQTFELYVEPTVYQDGEIDYLPEGGKTFDDLIALVVAMQNAQIAEEERNRAEQERIAREGEGTYADHEFRIGYIDKEGNQQYIEYQDSRVGRNERNKALNEGGYYIDDTGDLQIARNTYKDAHGNTHTADLSELQEMSFMAVAAQAKGIAGDKTYALLSESHSHGNTGVRAGENTDNSKYWSEQSEVAATRAERVLQQIDDVQSSTFPTYQYDPYTGHLYYTGSTMDLQVDNTTGHLMWIIDSTGGSGGSGSLTDIEARISELEAALNLSV